MSVLITRPARTIAPAQHARELLLGHHLATLTITSASAGSTTSVVELVDVAGGLPRLVLEHDSPAVRALAACRVAVLRVVDPVSGHAVRITGSFRMGRPDALGRRSYEPTLLSVRVEDATGAITVPVSDFLRATPDPARLRDGALLTHLEVAHAADLVAAVRRTGHACDVVLVERSPAGLELHALGVDGVVRLALGPDAGGVALSAVCTCPRDF